MLVGTRIPSFHYANPTITFLKNVFDYYQHTTIHILKFYNKFKSAVVTPISHTDGSITERFPKNSTKYKFHCHFFMFFGSEYIPFRYLALVSVIKVKVHNSLRTSTNK